MPTSEARIIANRRNAARSTGPRTVEGKQRSRANAVKHGMTGEGVVLPAEVAEVVRERFLGMQEELAPRTILGAALVKRAAMLTVRLDRSYDREAAALTIHVLGARAALDDSRKAEAEHLLHRIGAEPATNYRRLMATPEGVDAMIEEWARMKLDLENPHGTQWSYTHYHQADYLHGSISGNVQPTFYMAWTLALNGNYEHIVPERLGGLDDHARRQLALSRLVELVDADLARLRDHRATMDTRGHDAERELAPTRALFDASKGAILARKYEAAAERGLYRALRELRQVEAEAAAHEEVTGPESGPELEDDAGELGSFEPDDPEPEPEPARRDPKPSTGPVGRPKSPSIGGPGRAEEGEAGDDGPA